jgi:hypothetical protein
MSDVVETLERITDAIGSTKLDIDGYRVVCALESIATSLQKLSAASSSVPLVGVSVESHTKPFPASFGSTPKEMKGMDYGAGNDACVETQAPLSPSPAEADAGVKETDDERLQTKLQLRALGIPFKESARLPTLQKLLADHNQANQMSPCCAVITTRKFYVRGTQKMMYCGVCGRIVRLIENGKDVIPVPKMYFLDVVNETLPVADPMATTSSPATQEQRHPVAPPAVNPVPISATPVPASAETVTITLDEVRQALNVVVKQKGKDEALRIIKALIPGSKLSEAKPEMYPSIIAACKAAEEDDAFC